MDIHNYNCSKVFSRVAVQYIFEIQTHTHYKSRSKNYAPRGPGGMVSNRNQNYETTDQRL